jgi:hypothetical protein
VGHAVFVGYFDLRGRRAGKQDLLRGQRRVGVEHEDLSKVCPRGAQQVEPVRLGLGERLFVTEYHLLAVVVEFSQSDEGPPLVNLAVSPWHREPLRVSKDAGVFFLGQNPRPPPVREIPRCPGINVVASRFVKEFRQTENDAHQVIQAALVVSLLHRWGNFVVGLGDDVFCAHHA